MLAAYRVIQIKMKRLLVYVCMLYFVYFVCLSAICLPFLMETLPDKIHFGLADMGSRMQNFEFTAFF